MAQSGMEEDRGKEAEGIEADINAYAALHYVMTQRCGELESTMSQFETADPYFLGYARGMAHGFSVATDQIVTVMEAIAHRRQGAP